MNFGPGVFVASLLVPIFLLYQPIAISNQWVFALYVPEVSDESWRQTIDETFIDRPMYLPALASTFLVLWLGLAAAMFFRGNPVVLTDRRNAAIRWARTVAAT